ncbi:MAG: AAA family ATPase [Selenomonadaceae bacterium]|nr:AAA family ATPase [Selenomonadaceae bacterium]
MTLENFRAIKSLTIDFDGKDTDIYGANGLGKTTIANAISWLLIDRPITDEPQFDPKTQNAHGLHHTASINMGLRSVTVCIFILQLIVCVKSSIKEHHQYISPRHS